MLTFLLNLRNNWKCGKHSGLHICCILWFILIWLPFIKCRSKLHSFYIKKCDGYIKCPICILFNRKNIEVKKCSCSYNYLLDHIKTIGFKHVLKDLIKCVKIKNTNNEKYLNELQNGLTLVLNNYMKRYKK